MIQKELPSKPSITKTVTISPDPHIWARLEQHTSENYGEKKISRVIDMLVADFIENGDIDFTVNYSMYDKVKKTLSVDHVLWEDFSKKLIQLFGKKKIKSLVLNELIKDYLD